MHNFWKHCYIYIFFILILIILIFVWKILNKLRIYPGDHKFDRVRSVVVVFLEKFKQYDKCMEVKVMLDVLRETFAWVFWIRKMDKFIEFEQTTIHLNKSSFIMFERRESLNLSISELENTKLIWSLNMKPYEMQEHKSYVMKSGKEIECGIKKFV